MREMKDSGVEWLGEVPAGWGLRQAGQLADQTKTLNEGMEETNLLSLSYGKVKRRDINATDGLLPASFETYNIIEPDDIVLRFTDLQNDQKSLRVGRATERGIITSAYVTVRPFDPSCSRYMYYALHAYDLRKGFYGMGAGVRQGLKWQEAKYIVLPWPGEDDRARIADFLDEKCAQIDRAITSAEQSIQEYKAYRKGLIDEVSVHGLSSASEKKKIGIPYVDWVPTHWTKAKFRFLLTEFVDCPHETPLYSPTGEYCVIRAGDQTAGGLVQGNMLRLEKDEYERRTRRLTLKRGDIVYGREGSWGKASFVPEDDRYCLGQRMMQFRCNENLLHPLFAAYVLNASYVYEQGRKDEVGSTSHHVNISTIASYRIVLPPLDEQRRIADSLDEKCAQIDRAVEAKQTIIDELKSYKKSLIYEVVTGKREV